MFEPIVTQLRDLLSGSLPDGGRRPSRAVLAANIREAAAAVRTAQVALARARAEQQLDRKRLQHIKASVEDLENRARNALLKGNDPLAGEAAEAIALLEDEKSALEGAIASFERDLANLSESLHRAQGRLRALKRGERGVEVRAHIHKAQSIGADNRHSALAEAEHHLEDIQHQQERDQIADQEFLALSVTEQPGALIEKLAEAGCGAPLKTRADDVLARLKSDLPPLLEKSE